MHIAVLGNRGSWYCGELERAATSAGHRFSRLEFPQLVAGVGTGGPLLAADGRALADVDAVIVRTMPPGSLEQVVFRMDVLARLEAAGIPVLNPPKAIECAVDKYLTTAKLASAGLTVPATIVCETSAAALDAFEQLGRDVVVKPLFGAEGRGILRVSDPDLALRAFRTLERIDAVLYLQQFIHHEGADLRVLVLGGKILGAISRHNAEDFRTNVARNGRAEPHSLTDAERQTARTAAAVVGAKFAGVDLLYDRGGRCYVIEVNAVPGWQAFGKTTGCDVAAEVVRYLETTSDGSPDYSSAAGR